ncbi:hypothetical protein EXN66_Car002670 [Channa argus]|uniref:Uncharacterized protein n=1 Tax=Channa argus TaxID=215402 RepID=A0A6G1PAD7_CHAAH|nr:hypothetical protein EXN66_Car002670 [Channa argus]
MPLKYTVVSVLRKNALHTKDITHSPIAKTPPDHHISTSEFYLWCFIAIYHLFMSSMFQSSKVRCLCILTPLISNP